MVDCYLCSDYKESECFSKKYSEYTLSPHNKTHDYMVMDGAFSNNRTIFSTPCKGHKSDIVKCLYCKISYHIECKVCKLHTFLKDIYLPV